MPLICQQNLPKNLIFQERKLPKKESKHKARTGKNENKMFKVYQIYPMNLSIFSLRTHKTNAQTFAWKRILLNKATSNLEIMHISHANDTYPSLRAVCHLAGFHFLVRTK